MHARANRLHCPVYRCMLFGKWRKNKNKNKKSRSLSYLRNWFRHKQNQRVQSDRVVCGQDMEEWSRALQSSAEAGWQEAKGHGDVIFWWTLDPTLSWLSAMLYHNYELVYFYCEYYRLEINCIINRGVRSFTNNEMRYTISDLRNIFCKKK